MPSKPEPPPDFEFPPEPKRGVTKGQVLAIIAIVLAAAVPIALQFGVDICGVTGAVGIELDACARIRTPVELTAEPPPSLRVPSDDAGAK